MQEDLPKHLEFVQAIISRMAGHSFILKGWSVTLSAALFALAAKDANPVFAIVALFPALSFWGLDAYYLRQERLFRQLYDDLRQTPNEGPGTMEPFSLSTTKYCGQTPGCFKTLWSPSVIGLHGAVVGAVLTAILILHILSS